MRKILFSGPIGPYRPQAWNNSLSDVTEQRVTAFQDIFTLRGHAHVCGGHLLAQNISAPSVWLESPRWEDFEREVKKGYDYVGISFLQNHTHVVADMCRMVRKLSPESKIILGSYGAMAVQAAFPEEEKKEIADYICVGEGIRFLRRLLGEPEDAPISVSHLPKWGANLPWLDLHPPGNVGLIFGSLGCPNACDFCGTTAQYNNQRIQLLEPRQVVKEMERYYRSDPNLQQIIFLEEDSFLEPEYLYEIGRLIREETEFGIRKIDFFVLGGVELVSAWVKRYSWDDLLLTGLGGVFVGIESKFAPQEGYHKREGNAREVTQNLLKRGISWTCGWMAGFDFHDRVNIYEDLNYLISLEPTENQLSNVCPFPGTPLWERLREEGRVDKEIPWEEVSFYGGGGHHYKNFEHHELMSLLEEGYKKLYNTWGSSLMRHLKVELNGYEYCQGSSNKYLREDRAQRHKQRCFELYPMLRACEYFAPNGIVRRQLRQLDERYKKLFGEPTTVQKMQSYYILQKAMREKVREAIDPRNRHPKEEPFRKYVYEGNGGKREPDSPPYKVLYPTPDPRYDFYRARKELKNSLLGKLADLLGKYDHWRGINIEQEINIEKGVCTL